MLQGDIIHVTPLLVSPGDTFALQRGWGWYQAPGQGSKQWQWEFTAQSRLLSWQGTGSYVSSQTGGEVRLLFLVLISSAGTH